MPHKSQRTLSFAPPPFAQPSTPGGTRQTPRRNASTITNYARPERIDQPFRNPDNPNMTPRASTRYTQDEDIQMDDAKENGNTEDDEDEDMMILPDCNKRAAGGITIHLWSSVG
jgi:hypothetical protein